MTAAHWVGPVIGGACMAAAIAVGRYLWQRHRETSGPDRVLDELIAAKGARVRYAGFDPAQRVQTAKKRARAERLKAQAHAIESRALPVPEPAPRAATVTPLKRRA